MKRRAELAVWMNGEQVGTWSVQHAEHSFTYADTWLASPNRRPISLSMPLRPTQPYPTAVVEPFFDNLLPDNDQIRRQISDRFGLTSRAPFELLSAIGRDCAGAIQLLPPGEEPGSLVTHGSPRTDAQIAALLSNVQRNVRALEDDEFRISLAGAQEKTGFLWHNKQWCVPRGSTPTTHIFKLPLPTGDGPESIDLSSSLENEWLCGRLLNALGVRCAASEVRTFARKRVLIVERFDRRGVVPAKDKSSRWIARLPQEDFCQATGTSPGQKYEAQGGPGIKRILEILLGSTDARRDRADFFRTQVLFWLLCATDGHAKNFSIFLTPDGFHLTPRYDVISVYPWLGRTSHHLSEHKVKLAMAVLGEKNRHYRWNEISVKHWLDTADQCGLGDGPQILIDVLESADGAIDSVRSTLPSGFPPDIAEAIFSGLQRKSEEAREQLARQR